MPKQRTGFMFGTDPEFFLTAMDGSTIPAETVVKSKESGLPMYWDNAAIELTIPPADSPQKLVTNVSKVLKKHVVPMLIKHKLVPKWVSATEIEEQWFKVCAHLCEFGCEPSITLDEQGMPKISVPFINPKTTKHRSAGCHLHLGMHEKYGELTQGLLFNPRNHVELTKTCDLFLGIPATLARFGEDDNIRRNVVGYGRASEFRPQQWGFEYRALPSWVLSNPRWLFVFTTLLNDVAYFLLTQEQYPALVDHNLVTQAINSGNREQALTAWLLLSEQRSKWHKAVHSKFVVPTYSIIFGTTARFNKFNKIITQQIMTWQPTPNFTTWRLEKF